MITTRQCPKCRQPREADAFISASPTAMCRRCRDRKSTLRTPDRVRVMNLWSKYRITAEQYDALRAEQNYRCAICGTHEDDLSTSRGGRPRLDGSGPSVGFRLVVDHCHDSNEVRGLLCVACNSAIGLLKDSPDVLAAAIRYLTATRKPLTIPNQTPEAPDLSQ